MVFKVEMGTVTRDVLRGALAEFLATTLFVFIGTGSVASTGEFLSTNADVSNGLVARIMPIAMAFGVAIMVLVYAFGHISGGHINPAVTLMLVLINQCELVRGVLYVIAQLLGATLGSLFLWACTSGLQGSTGDRGTTPPFNLGNNALTAPLNTGNGFFFEFLGTLLLCLTVSGTAVDSKSMAQGNPSTAPIAIGFAVFLAHVVLVPFTGCGINPARTFGPCLANSFAGNTAVWNVTWFYYVGPWTASVVSALIFKGFEMLAEKSEEKEEEGMEDPEKGYTGDESIPKETENTPTKS